jgi:hypothetical protein
MAGKSSPGKERREGTGVGARRFLLRWKAAE